MSHTPTPWSFTNGAVPRVTAKRPNGADVSICGVHKIGRDTGIEFGSVAANGEIIARAVNSHAALVEALEAARTWFAANDKGVPLHSDFWPTFTAVDAALTLAMGIV